MNRFENIKKEQEEEAMKRIAVVRSERFANEDHLKLTAPKRDEEVRPKYEKPSGVTPNLRQAPIKYMENQETIQQKESEPVKAEENMSSMVTIEDDKTDELKNSTTDETSTSNSNKMSDQESESIATSSTEEEGEFIVPQDETEVESRTDKQIENESVNVDNPSTPQQRLRCVARFSYQQCQQEK